MTIDHTSANAKDTSIRFADRTLGEIATQVPGATAVLRRYNLDFCCGGAESLHRAAAARGITVKEVEADLCALNSQVRLAVPTKPTALIEYILANYHEIHRRELPELINLAKRVEVVHRQHSEVPAGLAKMLARMNEELESHMRKEEQILFPIMRDGANPLIAAPIARMRLEHDQHGEHIKALESLTHDCTVPPDGCATWKALYAGIRKFIDDLMNHIHLENNELFPQFSSRISNAAP